MKTSTHLRKARALVNKGWCKGRFSMVNKEGVQCYCATGAIQQIAVVAPVDKKDAWSYLTDSIISYSPMFTGIGVIVFNDHPKTTKKDVLAVFDLAIKKAVEDERLASVTRTK